MILNYEDHFSEHHYLDITKQGNWAYRTHHWDKSQEVAEAARSLAKPSERPPLGPHLSMALHILEPNRRLLGAKKRTKKDKEEKDDEKALDGMHTIRWT
ncbi:hypothetical protein VNO77_02652 [Canavalia gladiata]|uniref:Uncharacterized protein n=1 Tax=Canavalia gladiata TaxID=3824 RepID=A0AAN9MTK5_CANGL